MPLSNRSTVIQGWLDRLRAGDDAARVALLETAGARLVRLAHKMLKGFPRVRRWEQTDDVLQNAILRLYRALESTAPESVRSFFNLAAVQIRRELIDLARHYEGPSGMVHTTRPRSRRMAHTSRRRRQRWPSIRMTRPA